jgi:hypothetical protein
MNVTINNWKNIEYFRLGWAQDTVITQVVEAGEGTGVYHTIVMVDVMAHPVTMIFNENGDLFYACTAIHW